MEKIFISIDCNDFLIELNEEFYEDHKMRYNGSVVEVQMYDDGYWEYQSNESSDTTKERSNACEWLYFIYCYRGVWEGRVYFKNDEYWGEEMETINEIWKIIETMCRGKIKDMNPDFNFQD